MIFAVKSTIMTTKRRRISCIVFFSLLLLCHIPSVKAQRLTGRVVEVNAQSDTVGIQMAALQWQHTDIGVHSDALGFFSLQRTQTDTLLVFFPTYQPDTVIIGKEENNITILLSRTHTLAEVSIIAHDGSYISTQPILTTVITQQGLRRAACCNLAESFESTIAVDMEFSDAITGARQIAMLGLAGIYSQILLENVPMIRLLSHQFGLGFVPGSWMESINVSKGVASVTNGYEAITGQINVDYKKPETNYERVFLNAYGNSMGKGELSFNSRWKVGKKDKVSTMLMLFAGDQFAEIDMNKDGFLDIPKNQQINVMNRWDYKASKFFRGRTMVDFVWDNRVGGQKGYSWQESIPSYGFTPELYGLHIDNKKWDVITKNGFLLKGEDESIGTIVSYTGHLTDAVFGLRDYSAFQNSLYANILYSNKFGSSKRHKLTAGGSLQYDHYQESIDRLTAIDPQFSLDVPTIEAVPGVFAEYCYILEPKLVVMAGMRLDYNFLYNRLFWTPRLHLKWQATENFAMRASAGKGYRTAYVYTENLALLTSNRDFYLFHNEKQAPEEAYNAGVSFVYDFRLPGGKSSFSIDYFYTYFINQTIIDLDRDVHSIWVYNLNGEMNGYGNKSRSHAFQAELTLMPFTRFEIILAYRFNDVRYSTNGIMREKVLTSPHKGLLNLNYSTRYDKWKFNVTLQVNGRQRLPDTRNNPVEYQRPEYSPTYCLLSAQVTKKFRRWEIYLGGENLLNYKQENPIIAADDPFGDYFDATMIYAPITGIMGYLGVRYMLK